MLVKERDLHLGHGKFKTKMQSKLHQLRVLRYQQIKKTLLSSSTLEICKFQKIITM